MAVFRNEDGWGVSLQVFLKGSVQRVFEAVTSPEEMARWDYPDGVTADLRVRGWIRFNADGFQREGVITHLEPPRLFAYRIPTPFPAPDRHRSFEATIRFLIEDVQGISKLTLHHLGFPRREIAKFEEKAWRTIYLPRLIRFVEQG